jgi:hypothetical protein
MLTCTRIALRAHIQAMLAFEGNCTCTGFEVPALPFVSSEHIADACNHFAIAIFGSALLEPPFPKQSTIDLRRVGLEIVPVSPTLTTVPFVIKRPPSPLRRIAAVNLRMFVGRVRHQYRLFPNPRYTSANASACCCSASSHVQHLRW